MCHLEFRFENATINFFFFFYKKSWKFCCCDWRERERLSVWLGNKSRDERHTVGQWPSVWPRVRMPPVDSCEFSLFNRNIKGKLPQKRNSLVFYLVYAVSSIFRWFCFVEMAVDLNIVDSSSSQWNCVPKLRRKKKRKRKKKPNLHVTMWTAQWIVGRLVLTVAVLLFIQGTIQELKLTNEPNLAAVQCEDILPVKLSTFFFLILIPRFCLFFYVFFLTDHVPIVRRVVFLVSSNPTSISFFLSLPFVHANDVHICMLLTRKRWNCHHVDCCHHFATRWTWWSKPVKGIWQD